MATWKTHIHRGAEEGSNGKAIVLSHDLSQGEAWSILDCARPFLFFFHVNAQPSKGARSFRLRPSSEASYMTSDPPA